MPKVIFINRFTWPDETATGQLLTDLSESLAGRGLNVTVIASRPAGSPVEELRKGVRILRVGSTRSRAAAVAAKALDFGTFYVGALVKLLLLARRGDAVVALTDPPLIGIGATFVAELRGAKAYHWVQDIYPEIAAALSGRRELLLFRPLRNGAWQSARACVTLGSGMADVLLESGVGKDRIHIVPNWPLGNRESSPETIGALRAAWGLSSSFIVAYSGNLGRVHDLDSILDVADALRQDPTIVFVFIGDGARRQAIEAAARSRRLPNVRFLPFQPRENLAASLKAADVHLVTLKPGCGNYVFPSKLAGAAAAGRPVLFLGDIDSEAAQIPVDHRFGASFSRRESASAAELLKAWKADSALRADLGRSASAYAEALGNADCACQVWTRLLNLA